MAGGLDSLLCNVLGLGQFPVWYSRPTAIRMLMKAGTDHFRNYKTALAAFPSSVGEPLNPEAVLWSSGAFGVPFHDN
jgi:acetyl-CoA synthetase